MKKLIFILLLIPSFLRGATYYIDPAGVDDAGRNGSISQPWATMNYVRTRASAGDIVFVNAGTYVINSTVNWPAGVSIDGAGRDLVIFTSASDPSTMFLLSSTPGTNGNQFIRNISIDGNLITSMGIRIFGRSNVIMHDFTIKNTLRYGLTFADQSGRNEVTTPTHWAIGNKAYNFLIQNCGRDHLYYSENGDYYTWQADGGMDISGQDGMEIYDFEIDNQTGGRYAYGLKGLISGGFHKGVKIHDGKIRVNRRDIDGQQSFAFAVELWTVLGGVEVYNLDCNGGIDISGRGAWDSDNYGYAIKVYDNKCVLDQRPTNYPESGLILESGGSGGMFFMRNWIENFSHGFHLGTTAVSLVQGYDSVVTAYNVFANIGYTSGGVGAGMSGYNISTGVNMNRIYFVNNVVHKVNNAGGWGVNFEYGTANTWSNTYVRNNIFYNCYTPVQFTNQIIQSLYVDNNLIYGHTRTEIPRLANSTVIFFTSNDNITDAAPMFVDIGTNFELQSGSPAINAGINVGLDKDFRGWALVGLPDIGAYEFGAVAPTPPAGGFLKDQSGVMLRSVEGTFMRFEGEIEEPEEPEILRTLGTTEVLAQTSGSNNRRAVIITFPEDGEIRSISLNHAGGTGGVIMGIYENDDGVPGALLGTTGIVDVNETEGWQTASLTSPISVDEGESVWLAWIFQNNVGMRYVGGSPDRAQAAAVWAEGLPNPFGEASMAAYRYSAYCTYAVK